MRKTLTTLAIAVALILATPANAAEAAPATPTGPVTREVVVSRGLRRQLNLILFGGFAGGVLGLSTLSFYGRPQDKLSIITMGAGLGLIIGAVASTSMMVSSPQDLLAGNENQDELLTMRETSPRPQPLGLRWKFTF